MGTIILLKAEGSSEEFLYFPNWISNSKAGARSEAFDCVLTTSLVELPNSFKSAVGNKMKDAIEEANRNYALKQSESRALLIILLLF